MIRNRTVPVDTILPHLVYRDVAAALGWLERAFGFVEAFRYGDPASPQGAQMRRGSVWIMLSSSRPGSASPAEAGVRTQSLTVFLEDVEAHCQRARAAGAAIVEEPHETVYGEFQCAVHDLEGHLWIFSRHARDLDPREWGATVPAST